MRIRTSVILGFEVERIAQLVALSVRYAGVLGLSLLLDCQKIEGQVLTAVDLFVPEFEGSSHSQYVWQTGSFVSIDGDHAFVGHQGRVHVFHRNAGGQDRWNWVRTLTPENGPEYGYGAGVMARYDELNVVQLRRVVSYFGLPTCFERRVFRYGLEDGEAWTLQEPIGVAAETPHYTGCGEDHSVRISISTTNMVLAENAMFYVFDSNVPTFSYQSGYTVWARGNDSWVHDTSLFAGGSIWDNMEVYVGVTHDTVVTAHEAYGNSPIHQVFIRSNTGIPIDSLSWENPESPNDWLEVIGMYVSPDDRLLAVGLTSQEGQTGSPINKVVIHSLVPPYSLVGEIIPAISTTPQKFGKELVLRDRYLAVLEGGEGLPHAVSLYERQASNWDWEWVQRIEGMDDTPGVFMDMNAQGELIIGRQPTRLLTDTIPGFVRVYHHTDGTGTAVIEHLGPSDPGVTIANGYLYLTGLYHGAAESVLQIFDLSGRDQGIFRLVDVLGGGIPIGHLAQGIYVATVQSPGGNRSTKFVL